MKLLNCMFFCLTLLFAAQPAPADSTPPQEEILNGLKAVAEAGYWPDYNPLSYPIAFWDGTNTTLYFHPSPPEGFEENGDGVYLYPGRHEIMSANTSVNLNGHLTATVLLEADETRTTAELTALAAHELYHVYQRSRHPSWNANEAQLFNYPFTDLEILTLRYAETEAMRSSLAADTPEERNRWAMTALAYRQKRSAMMDEASLFYERDQEINEGLAMYIQLKAEGADPLASFPENGWEPQSIRQRCYMSGAFWAMMLDEFRPGWKELLNDKMYAHLDVLLAAVMPHDHGVQLFDTARLASLQQRAARSIDAYRNVLLEKRQEFEESSGWRIEITVENGAHLLAPRGFDPLNVLNLGEGVVLHTRMLNLGNNQGSASMLDHQALSFGPNGHPLFNGVRWMKIAGIADKPTIVDEEGHISITAGDVRVEFDNATMEIDGKRILIHLHPLS